MVVVVGDLAWRLILLASLSNIALAAIFLGESLLWYHYVGALLIFSGIFVATRAGVAHAKA